MKFQIIYRIGSLEHSLHFDHAHTGVDMLETLQGRRDVWQIVALQHFPGGEYKTTFRYDRNIVPATCYEPGNPIDPRD